MSTRKDSLSAARMGTAPVGPLLASLAVPMMISMLVQALYNVVDSIFVSHMTLDAAALAATGTAYTTASEAALTALSLAFPVQSLIIAFAVGTGVGVNAHLSKCLGEGNRAEADRAAMNGLLLSLLTFAVFFAVGLFLVKPFFTAQVDDPLVRQYGESYLSICLLFSMGCFVQCMVEKLLTATGRSTYSMFTQLLGAVSNIILDPILIFGLLGAPKMGVAGAAAATVLGQWIGAAAGLLLNLFKNDDIHLRLRDMRPSARTIRRIYAVAVPSIAMSAIGSVMSFSMNNILKAFPSAVAVFGVYFKLQSFIFMPVFGLNNGMVPIISYNYGARKPERILKVFRLGVAAATCIMVAGVAVAQLAPAALLGLFNAEGSMLSTGVVALRIISLHFVFAGYNIICTATFQALGRGMLALWGSVVRQLVVLIPAAYLLSLAGRVELVWLAFPIAELASLCMCTAFLLHCYKTIIRPMRTAAPGAPQ